MSFWANAVNPQVAAAPRPAYVPPAAPTQQLVHATQQAYPQAYPQQPPAAPNKAVSARSDAMCPECGSDYIFKPHGNPNAMQQCYNCGWNPRFAHSTAGGGLPSDASTPTQPSRQVSTANNFNPQTIIAKIE